MNKQWEWIQWIPVIFGQNFLGCQGLCPTSMPLTATIQAHCALSLADPRGFKLETRIFLLWSQCKMQWCNLATKCLSLGYDSNSLAANMPAKCYLLEASTSSTGARKEKMQRNFIAGSRKVIFRHLSNEKRHETRLLHLELRLFWEGKVHKLFSLRLAWASKNSYKFKASKNTTLAAFGAKKLFVSIW